MAAKLDRYETVALLLYYYFFIPFFFLISFTFFFLTDVEQRRLNDVAGKFF